MEKKTKKPVGSIRLDGLGVGGDVAGQMVLSCRSAAESCHVRFGVMARNRMSPGFSGVKH